MTDASVVTRRFTARRPSEAASAGVTSAETNGPVYLSIRMVSGIEYRVSYECSQLAHVELLEIVSKLRWVCHGNANDFTPVHGLTLEGGSEIHIVVPNIESLEIVPVIDECLSGVYT